MRNYLFVSSFIGLLACCIQPLDAQPSGMEVIAGAAESSHPATSTLQIQASDRAIIQWDSFSIGAGEMTKFVLPDAASAVLNRVTGSQMSELLGVLQSNGQIYLINPQGVLVGPDAKVDTASFIASTFDVFNEDFLAKADLLFQGNSNAMIVNLGTIATHAGDCVLLARYVENKGAIEAPQGTAALGAGSQILLKPSDSNRIFILARETDSKEEIGVNQQGRIASLFAELKADGNAYAHAIRHDGAIEASGIKEQNGRILLVAEEGRIDVTGQTKATAAEIIASLPENDPEAVYGEIRVLGREIYVLEDAKFDVSNEQGGGLIKIGYELAGYEARAKGLITAERVHIAADALQEGSGGKVMLWGNDANLFLSHISARGGSLGGNGGFVEVSSLGQLAPKGLVNTSAPNGEIGQLLFDPTDITVGASDANISTSYNSSTNTLTYNILNPAVATTISAANLASNLSVNNVFISTTSSGAGNGDITVSSAVSFTPTSAATTLNLFANRDININANVTGNGTGNVSLISTRDVNVTGAVLSTNSGSLSVLSNRNVTVGTTAATTASAISTATGALSITTTPYYDNTSLVSVIGTTTANSVNASIASTSGNIAINAAGGLTLTGGGNGANTSSATISTGGSGTVTVNTGVEGAANAIIPGNVTLTAGGVASSGASISTVNGILTLNIRGSSGSTGLVMNGASAAVSSGALITSTGSGNMIVSVDGPLSITSNSDQLSCGIIGTTGSATVVVNSNATLTGGAGAGGNAVIKSAAVTTNILGNLTLTSGTASATGNSATIQATTTTLSLSVGGNCTLTGANGGTANNGAVINGATGTTVAIGSNLIMTSNAAGANGASAIISGTAGTTNITVGGSAYLTGGSGTGTSGAVALIQNGGTLNLTCSGDLVLTGGSGSTGQAQIGTPTTLGIATGGAINVTANNIMLTAGSNATGATVSGAWIGHGLTGAALSTQTAAINVTALNSIFLYGGTNGANASLAQIGHVATTAGGGSVPIGGNITVTAGNSMRIGGNTSVANNNATIGHGPQTTGYTYGGYTIQVIAGKNVSMFSTGATAGAGQAQIINLGSQTANAITVVCDNNSPTAPDYGVGYFVFTSNSVLQSGPLGAANSNAQVRVYSSVRIFNSTGVNTYSAVPINGVSPAGYPSTLGTNSNNEIWGVYYDPTQAPGGGGTYPAVANNGFVFYYKRTGGVLISQFATTGGSFSGGAFSFNANTPEVYIQDTDLITALNSGNVTINAENISNNIPTNGVLNGNSIYVGNLTSGTIAWPTIVGNPNSVLTLIAGNDIHVEGTFTNQGTLTGGGIVFNAGRDVNLGTGSLAATNSALTTTAAANPITVTTGRDFNLLGSCSTAATVNSQISTSAGGTVTVTVGRDLQLLASQGSAVIQTVTSGSGLIITTGRNCIQNGGSAAGAQAWLRASSTNMSINIAGLHTMIGGTGSSAFAQVGCSGTTMSYTAGTGLSLSGGTGGGGLNNVGAAAHFQCTASSSNTITITNGNLAITGGPGVSNQIFNSVNAPLTINVPNGSLLMQGASGSIGGSPGSSNFYGDVRIANFSTGANSTITINVGGDLRLTAGSGPNCNATIYAGDVGVVAPIALTIGGNLFQTAGSNVSCSSQIIGNRAITLQITGDHVLKCQTSFPANFLGSTSSIVFVQSLAPSGTGISATIGGNLLMTAGIRASNGCAFVNQSNANMTVSVGNQTTKAGDVILTAGPTLRGQAAIALNGTGTLNLSIGGHLIATAAATGYEGYAGIATGLNTVSPTLNIGPVGGNIILNANGYNYAIIGNGGQDAAAAPVGTNATVINISNVGGDIILNGATNASISPLYALSLLSTLGGGQTNKIAATGGMALIGNLNPPQSGQTLGGNISVTCNGSIILNSGSTTGSITTTNPITNAQNTAAYAVAQIGHGGAGLVTGATAPTVNAHAVLLQPGRNFVMNTPAVTGSITSVGAATVANRSNANSPATNYITIATDSNYPTAPNFGTGYFSMSSGSLITTGTSPIPNVNTPVRIYTPVRLFNTVNAATINGTAFVPSPVLGLNNQYEQWGVYGPTGGTYTAGQAFNMYYKRVGGLLISTGADNGVSYNTGVYTFTVPEATINAGTLGNNLDIESVVINTSGLASSPLGSTTNSVVITGNFGWFSPNTLTINASQDIVVNNAITSSDATGVAQVTLNATRNMFIGDAAQTAASGITTTSAPVSCTTGGSFNMFSGNVANASSAITSGGAATITASNNMSMRAGNFSGTSALITSTGGNVTVNVLSGDLNLRGSLGSSAAAVISSTASSATAAVSVSNGNLYAIGGAGNLTGPTITAPTTSINVPLGNFVLQAGSGIIAGCNLASQQNSLAVNVGQNFSVSGGPIGGFINIGASNITITAGGNISLTAGSGPSGGNITNYVIVGFPPNSGGNTINVTAGGSIAMTAQNNGYVLIGTGFPESNIAQTNAGNITVAAGGGIALQGQIAGQSSDRFGFAKIGHVTGTVNGSTLSGDISVTAGDQVALQGGSFNASTAASGVMTAASGASIGHGGNFSSATYTANGATTVTARAISILAGQGANGGSALIFASGNGVLSATVTGGDLYLLSGGSANANAVLSSANGSFTANVTNGNIALGSGLGSATTALTSVNGNMTASCVGSITLIGGISDSSPAYIGQSTLGTLTVSSGMDCIITSGAGNNSFAEIGCINPSSTAITVNIGGHLLMTAQGVGYTQIGNGQVTSPAGVDVAAINVTTGGNIVLNGTSTSIASGAPIAYGGFGFSQIGHLNSQSGATAIAGNINVTSGGSVYLNPGLKSTAWGRIGHGGISKLAGNTSVDSYGTGAITVLAAGNIVLATGPTTINSTVAQAQVVNPCRGNIWLVADNLYPTSGSGTGYFFYSATNGNITAQSSFQVRIYAAAQVFNEVANGSIINGQTYVPAPLPLPPLPEGFGSEQWGYYYSTDSANPYIGPNFTLYYKRIGGLVISADTTKNATLSSGGIYSFSAAEAIINTTDLQTALGLGNTTINAANLPNTSDASNSILFRAAQTSASPIAWSNLNELIVQAPADIAIRSTITQSSVSNSALGISMNAGRDVLIGAYAVSTSYIQTSNAPVTIVAGRDFSSLGVSLPVSSNPGGAIVSLGTGAGVNPITVTAGRNATLLGGPFLSPVATNPAFGTGGINTQDASISLTAQGDSLMQGGYGSAAGLFTNATISGQGNITANITGNLTLEGGAGRISRTWMVTNGSISSPLISNLTLTVGGNISQLSGYGNALYADNAVGSAISTAGNGTTTIVAGGYLLKVGSPSYNTNNGLNGLGGGNVSVTTGGDLSITSGIGANSQASISGIRIALSVGGNLTLTASNLPLAQTSGFNAAVIGFGNAQSITISKVGGNLTINGNRNNTAVIGSIPGSATSSIVIQNVSGSVILNAYNGLGNTVLGNAQIGFMNNAGSSTTTTADITIAAAGNFLLNGGSSATAYARIGNGGVVKTGGTDTIQGNVTLLSGHGNLTLNTGSGSAVIAAFGTGAVTTVIAGNTNLNGTALVTSQSGGITMLSGQSQFFSGSSQVSNTSSGGISIVADNLYPKPAKVGLGRIITGTGTSITSPGPVRLYSAAQQIDAVLGTINTKTLTPGPLNVNSAMEQWFKYYPQYFGGFPFTFFYKTSLQAMVLDAVAANSTLTQFLPLSVPVVRAEKKRAEEAEKKGWKGES